MSVSKFYLNVMRRFWKKILKILFLYKIPVWSEITVDKLFDRVNSNLPPLLIDVRSAQEFNGGYGHIPNAMSIPILELESNFEDLDSLKEKEIVTMCPGGGMSLVAVDILAEAGFKDVKSLKGGTDLWHQSGYPTTHARVRGTKTDIPPLRLRADIRVNDKMLYKVTKVHKTLDARGLSCPMPILKSRKALKELAINQVLEILTTDPGSITDIPRMTRATGQELITSEERGQNEYRFLVKRLK